MKHILLSCILSVGALTSPVLTQPAAAQTQIESLKDMVSWMQSAAQIQTDLMSLFSADTMTNLYGTIESGDTEAINRLGQEFEAERQVVLARAKQQIENLPPPEKWNVNRSLFSNQDRATHKAAKIQYDSLQETYTLFDTLTEALSGILNSADSADEAQLAGLVDVQYKASVRLIELENEQVDGFLTAIPKDNPNHQFQKIVKQTNLAGIPEMNITMISKTLEERQANAVLMGKELKKIQPLIRRGKKDAQTQIKMIESIPTATLAPDQRALLPALVAVYKNFEDAFAVEAKILENLESSQEQYLSDKSDEEIESTIDQNNLEYFRLLEQRVALLQARLSALQ